MLVSQLLPSSLTSRLMPPLFHTTALRASARIFHDYKRHDARIWVLYRRDLDVPTAAIPGSCE